MNKSQLIQFLRENEIWAKRSMGQNFLVDDNVLRKIVEAAELKSSDIVVEIGPGLGMLTEELAKYAGKIITIEKDSELARKLNDEIRMKNDEQMSNVKILNQDVLEFNPSNLAEYKIVANIPYNITSVVIRKFLEAENKPSLMVLLVQKEVAERIIAEPGEMSLLSVSVQFYAEPEIISIVKKEAFFPVPEVDSAIVKFKIHPSRHGIAEAEKSKCKINERDLFRLVKFGFAARRKTLENNLAAGLHITKPKASDIIKKAGLPEKIRAQDLSTENWIKLTEGIYGRK